MHVQLRQRGDKTKSPGLIYRPTRCGNPNPTLQKSEKEKCSKQVGSNTQHYTKPRPMLPVDRGTAAAQTGATATARLSHLFCSNESGTKAATPRYDTVTNAIVSEDTIDDLRLKQTNKKKEGARRAPIFALVQYMQSMLNTRSSTSTSLPPARTGYISTCCYCFLQERCPKCFTAVSFFDHLQVSHLQ